mmetsp:Transcript_30144/g.79144  ORF Transcript_30144/g.79144 Transcript_30144/m.79144 type:complete len:230 (+) Transcript_30144:1044-1733(+)
MSPSVVWIVTVSASLRLASTPDAASCSSRVGLRLKTSRPTSPPCSSGSRRVNMKKRVFLYADEKRVGSDMSARRPGLSATSISRVSAAALSSSLACPWKRAIRRGLLGSALPITREHLFVCRLITLTPIAEGYSRKLDESSKTTFSWRTAGDRSSSRSEATFRPSSIMSIPVPWSDAMKASIDSSNTRNSLPVAKLKTRIRRSDASEAQYLPLGDTSTPHGTALCLAKS